jgi:hypothetical protein
MKRHTTADAGLEKMMNSYQHIPNMLSTKSTKDLISLKSAMSDKIRGQKE